MAEALDPRYGDYEPPDERPTAMYTMRDAAGAVLYVGISVHWPRRMKDHSEGSPWWQHVRTIDFEHFPNRQRALEAEAAAIHRHQPPFNIDHTVRGGCREELQACRVQTDTSDAQLVDMAARKMMAIGITSTMSQRQALELMSEHGWRGRQSTARHAFRALRALEALVAAYEESGRPLPAPSWEGQLGDDGA